MKKVVETILEGTVGLLALYVVGRVAWQAGYNMADAEHRYRALQREAPKSEPVDIPPARRRLFSRNPSVLRGLLSHPDDHLLEASVNEDGLDIRVKRKNPGNEKRA